MSPIKKGRRGLHPASIRGSEDSCAAGNLVPVELEVSARTLAALKGLAKRERLPVSDVVALLINRASVPGLNRGSVLGRIKKLEADVATLKEAREGA